MDVKSHMANNTTEESQTPKVVSAYSKRKQSHVTLRKAGAMLGLCNRPLCFTKWMFKVIWRTHGRGVREPRRRRAKAWIAFDLSKKVYSKSTMRPCDFVGRHNDFAHHEWIKYQW